MPLAESGGSSRPMPAAPRLLASASTPSLKLPRLGVGHEPPGTFDLYGDGTPAVGRPLSTFLEEPKKARRRRRRVGCDPALLAGVHRRLKEKVQQSFGNGNWQALFANADHDDSGTLEVDELRRMIRATLRIPPTDVSNDMIKLVFGYLDYNDSRSIETVEFEHFLRTGTNKRDTDAREAEQTAAAAPKTSALDETAARKMSLDQAPGAYHQGDKANDGLHAVEANPAAGTVRKRERDQPFLVGHFREIRMENKRFATSAKEKLIFELARQTHRGLAASLGLQVEMTSIANVIRLAYTTEHLSAAEIDPLPNAQDVRTARQVLKNVKSYHLKNVAALLNIDIPVKQTWGSRKFDV